MNLYVPDEQADALKREAQEAGMSLSAYVGSVLSRAKPVWPADFFQSACGFLHEDMEEPADAPPEPVG